MKASSSGIVNCCAFLVSAGSPGRLSLLLLLACLVRGKGESFLHGPLFCRRHLGRAEFEGQLVDRAGEAEWQLVTVVHSCARVAADVEGLVDGHEDWNRVRDRLFSQFLAVHCEYTGATLAGAGTVIFEVEDERVLAGRERLA